MKKFTTAILFIALIQSLIATLGSLFFSEVMKYTPCVLCWYQRIFMYPLVLILSVGAVSDDKKVYKYALPLSIMGLVISIYHNLLYYHVFPEGIIPCQVGVSCTTKFFAWFGFITIPLLSLVAFSVITLCLIIMSRQSEEKKAI